MTKRTWSRSDLFARWYNREHYDNSKCQAVFPWTTVRCRSSWRRVLRGKYLCKEHYRLRLTRPMFDDCTAGFANETTVPRPSVCVTEFNHD